MNRIKTTAQYNLYGINVSEFSLPPALGEITVTKFDKLGATVRLIVVVRGKTFRRLHDRLYPPVWAEGEMGNILSDKESNDLESIFKVYCEDLVNQNLLPTEMKLING